MKDRLLNALFDLDDGERSLLALAYYQQMVIKALLYFATEKGKNGFVPVPAMIAAAIIKAAYEHEYGIKPNFLPQNRLDSQYPRYPREIFNEDFWWDNGKVHSAQNEMGALRNIPEAMRIIVETVISEYSVLHPKGLQGVKMASWWPTRPCGNHRDNLSVYLTKQNLAEAELYLLRLGDENAAWCVEVGTIMRECMDASLPNGRCWECSPSL